jgi:K+-transporting ATPase A subunit
MTLAAAMLTGRFIYVIPLLAVADSLAQKSASLLQPVRFRLTARNS